MQTRELEGANTKCLLALLKRLPSEQLWEAAPMLCCKAHHKAASACSWAAAASNHQVCAREDRICCCASRLPVPFQHYRCDTE